MNQKNLHYSIYNIQHKKWGCLTTRVVQIKLTLLNVPWCFLFPPPETRKLQKRPPTGSCSARRETTNVSLRSWDLDVHPVLRRDGGHVGIVLYPYMVGFINLGKLWKKKRTGLLLLRITVL